MFAELAQAKEISKSWKIQNMRVWKWLKFPFESNCHH